MFNPVKGTANSARRRVRSRLAPWLGALLACLSWTGATAARADTSVIVLGVRSIEGDDEFARNLTAALRSAATQVAGWTVTSRDVTLAQMSLAHGCDDPDAACMAEIARTLQVQRVIYGTAARTSATNDYNFAVSMYLFNAETGQIESSMTDSVPSARTTVDQLREAARRYVGRLTGIRSTSTLRVQGNVPGAEVCVDDQTIGITDDRGNFVAPNVAAGKRQVEIRAPGYRSVKKSVSLPAGKEATVNIVLEEDQLAGDDGRRSSNSGSEGSSTAWIGWTALGVSAIMVGLTAYSWLRLGAIEKEPDYVSYRRDAGSMISDVCAEADKGNAFSNAAGAEARAGHVKSLCGEASTLEVLQYVFIATGVVAGGIGAYVLLSGSSSKKSAEEPALSLRPRVGYDGGGLSATLRF